MTDVLLRHQPDGGNIDCVNGQLLMSDGLETAAYLSIFGGNELDSGADGDALREWWGNKIERIEARKYRSRFQNLMASLPLVPGNLARLEEAAALDLTWFVDEGIATYVNVDASIPALNTVKLDVLIVVDGVNHRFEFTKQARDSASA
jgi:phage gp46-like protein